MENPDSRAFALVAASPDTDCAATMRALAGECPFPLLGGTSLGNPFDTTGDAFGTAVTVINRDGVRCGVALSEPVSAGNGADNGEALVRDLHARALEDLGCVPKLFLVFMPVTENFFAENLAGALFDAAGSVPVFGGMVSDDIDSARSSVFFGGGCHAGRIALAAIGGDIDPVFAVGLEVTHPTAPSPVVTDADGVLIRTVGGAPLADFLGKFDIDGSALADYPVTLALRRAGRQDVITSLVKLEADGSGIVSNTVLPGDTVSLCYLTRQNIDHSAQLALRRLAEEMAAKEKEGRTFDTVLAVSCVTRYYVVGGGGENAEAEALERMLPGGLAAFGMFGFAEYCPVPGGDGMINRMHGQTLALCAF